MRPPSLAFHLAIASGALTTIAMMGELFWRSRHGEALWPHVVHGALLGLLAYAALHVLLRLLVTRPLHDVAHQLYGVATGRLHGIEVRSRVREVAEITRAADLMVRRMRMAAQAEHRTELADLDALRALSARLAPREASEALERIARLERALEAPRSQADAV